MKVGQRNCFSIRSIFVRACACACVRNNSLLARAFCRSQHIYYEECRVGSANGLCERDLRVDSASKMRVTHKVVFGSLKARCHLEDPDIGGKIILKLFLYNIKIAVE